MIISKKIGLLVSVILAAVLGAGCGRGNASPAETREEKISKISNNPEVKEQREKCIKLIADRCGFAEEKVENIKKGLEFIEAAYIAGLCDQDSDPNRADCEKPSKEDLKAQIKTLQLYARQIRCKQDLYNALNNGFGGSITYQAYCKIMDSFDISDSDIKRLRSMFLDDSWIDLFLNSLDDWFFAIKQQL